MKIDIQTSICIPADDPQVGNVYPVKGGRGLRAKHMMVLIAITAKGEYRDPTGIMLVIDKEGNPVGCSSYGMHYVGDLAPIAFVEGLDELTLLMRSI